MTGDEFAQQLQLLRQELIDEVILHYQRGNDKRGRLAFDRWKERFMGFLQEYVPNEAKRFENEMRHFGFAIISGEHPYETFMREDGENCFAFIDDLAESAVKGRIAELQKQAIESKKTIASPPPLSEKEAPPILSLPDLITILFLAADPTNASRLRLGEEAREILEKLQLAKQRERFNLQQRMSVRATDISQALLDVQPHIVHFSGHGMATGELCFENHEGQIQPVSPNALASLFEQFANQVHCVVLNACYSEAQANAIAKHINYVVGMNQAIGDRAAIAFAIGFYQALGAGRTVEDAYQLGCVQIRLQGIPEHLTPILIKGRVVTEESSTQKRQIAVNKLSFPEYTSFQQDLENLIGYATNNFSDIREGTPTTYSEGRTSYASKFSFEYSASDTVWQHNGKWYFTCDFFKDGTLQQAIIVFEERVQAIKSKLSNEWKFEERENPNRLYRREFEAIRKYNTLRIKMSVAAYSSEKTQVGFMLEQL